MAIQYTVLRAGDNCSIRGTAGPSPELARRTREHGATPTFVAFHELRIQTMLKECKQISNGVNGTTGADAAIISIYYENVPAEVVECQQACISRWLPDKWVLMQYLWDGVDPSHARALDESLAAELPGVIVLLDIDCIPLTPKAFPFLYESARNGALVGGVQRANHIENGRHLYVGPFCMAFALSEYNALGRPSFAPTHRGDVGEELTYRWEETHRPIRYLWPTDVRQEAWDLVNGRRFGFGTTFEGLFYHSFSIRNREFQHHFIERCRSELSKAGVATP